ncbi:MAG TPA: ATP-binding protein [Candidatus Saccharimonadales bacterium]|nr:ATP-binding protein [Candidatus Saccharimonadales bacterium]
MFSTDEIIELIKAHKSGSDELFDKTIQKLVRSSEQKGKKGVAKALRDIYSKPNEMYRKVTQSSLKQMPVAPSFEVDTLPDVSLDDVVLSKRNEMVVDEIIQTWNSRKKLKAAGISHSTKVIFYGLPGTGKTYLANALAGTLNLPIVHVDVSKLISSFLGETGKNVTELFSGKEQQILFLDEFESLAKNRADEMDIGEAKRIVTAILQNVDTLNDDVLLIAATNHIEMIDTAIRRRFTYEIDMDDIDLASRRKMFDLYLKGHNKVENSTIDTLGELATDFTGHDIQRVYTKTMRRSVLGLDKLSFEEQIFRQLVETKYRKKRFNSKDTADVTELKKVVNVLWSVNKKYFTYEVLENMTGIPHATIHYLVTKGVAK